MPTSHKSSLSSGDLAAIGIGVTLGVLILIALTIGFLFLRRKRRHEAPPRYLHEETTTRPQELESQETQNNSAFVQRAEGVPGHSTEEIRMSAQDLELRDTQIHEAFVWPGELESWHTQPIELDGGV
jgi:uncharacterized protein HemX